MKKNTPGNILVAGLAGFLVARYLRRRAARKLAAKKPVVATR
jgi:hypothetical protein